jgi:hypothetical protein
MSASLQPMTQTLWLSWPIDEAMAPLVMPKPLTKPCRRCRGRCGPAPPPSDIALDVGHEGAVADRHFDRQRPVGIVQADSITGIDRGPPPA